METAMRVPVWLTLGIALLAFVWGAYRIRIAFRSDDADERARDGKRGLFALGRRTHLLFGIVYLLLGGALLATSLGWNPVGGLLGPRTEPPAHDAAPSKPGSVPADQLPPAPPPAARPSK
jgi:hypothetical protein